MGINFSAFELFEIAIRIEENAYSYYKQAAELSKDNNFAKTFLELAEMEKEHKETFLKLSQTVENIQSNSAFDPFEEAKLYLEAVADLHGGEGSIKKIVLTGNESYLEIIDLAIELEKKSILFYVGLKSFVQENEDWQKILSIIEEEKKHLVQLAQLRIKDK